MILNVFTSLLSRITFRKYAAEARLFIEVNSTGNLIMTSFMSIRTPFVLENVNPDKGFCKIIQLYRAEY